jgi:hypothetical protein
MHQLGKLVMAEDLLIFFAAYCTIAKHTVVRCTKIALPSSYTKIKMADDIINKFWAHAFLIHIITLDNTQKCEKDSWVPYMKKNKNRPPK